MTTQAKSKRHQQWWARENARALVGPYVPLTMPCGGLDIERPASQMREKALRHAAVLQQVPGDMLVVICANFSVALVPVVAGAGFQYDAHTSWSVPVASSIDELRITPFRADHPLYQQYLERLQPLLDNWSWDTYLPGLADYLGPLDILAALLGPEELAVAMMLQPDEVKKHVMDAAQFLRDMLAHERGFFGAGGGAAVPRVFCRAGYRGVWHRAVGVPACAFGGALVPAGDPGLPPSRRH
jgi:hypothetical protein